MSRAMLLAVVAACEFSHGSVPVDSQDAAPPDVIVPTWAIDATSRKAVPSSGAQWSDLLSAYGFAKPPPDHLWLMQEGSGSLQDSMAAISLSPVNGPTYANPIPGWTRVAVGTIDTTINQGFVSGATGNLNGSSYLLLVYLAVLSPPGAERSLLGIGANGDHRYVAITPTPRFEADGIGVVPTIGSADPTLVVHPVALEIDGSRQKYVVYTDEERLEVPWVATNGLGDLLVVGTASIGGANARYLYGVLWAGSAAEMSDPDVKKLLQSLGWTVSGF